MVRSSYSQHTIFEGCPKQWWLQYVQKVSVVTDTSYADAGNALHKTIEIYYKNKSISIDNLKREFIKIWYSLRLDKSLVSSKKDLYWEMVLNCINKNIEETSVEMEIFFPEVLGYLDLVNTRTNEIHDWKSSTRSEENDTNYRKQVMFYSWLYYRKFNRLPERIVVHYLKYKDSTIQVKPTISDILDIEQWYNKILIKMNEYIVTNKEPPMSDNCFMFCPYPNICKNTGLNFTIHLLGHYMRIEGTIPPLLKKGIEKKFSYELKDAFWIRRNNPNAYTTVRFYNHKQQKLPIGFLEGLKKTMNDYAEYVKQELHLNIIDDRVFNNEIIAMPDKFLNGITLRDYQQQSVDAFLKHKIGVLRLATAAGKTEIAIEVMRVLKYKTLFIVDKIELLRQTKERIEKALGIEVGQIGQGIDNPKHITVATIQTLFKHLHKYAEYLKTIRVLITDECHKLPSHSYWRVAHYMPNTEYRLGISATPTRDDGNQMMIFATSGNIIFNINSKELIDKGWLIKPRVVFITDYVPLSQMINYKNKIMEYNDFYRLAIADNPFRNNVILNLVNKNPNKKILILTKLITHGATLHQLIPNSEHLYGETSADIRKDIFDRFVRGNLNILVSTISIFSEGIDVKPLQIIINAGGNRGDIKTIQMLGRILRTMEGKQNAIYYDFFDNYKYFKQASNARMRILSNEGHEVEEENDTGRGA